MTKPIIAGKETDALTNFDSFIVNDEPAQPAQQVKKQRYEILTAASFFEPQEPINWIVDGLISAGSVSVFFGEAGCGKTLSLIHI